MDWFQWLSGTNLDTHQIYQYALTFTHNELAEDDVAYFSHEFLQSMGVAVAKHRLEILKLAAKTKTRRRIMHPLLWFMLFYDRTRKYVSRHVRTVVDRDRSPSSLSLVPRRNHSLRWKVAMLQRNKTPSFGPRRHEHDPGVLMLTNGSPGVGSGSSGSSWVDSEGVGESDRFGPSRGESWSDQEIKWDAMFKNLNPT